MRITKLPDGHWVLGPQMELVHIAGGCSMPEKNIGQHLAKAFHHRWLVDAFAGSMR